MERNELLVTYGEDVKPMVRELLERARLAEDIPQGAKIGIKPNLVVARPCTEGATTSPEIAAALVEYLQEHGHRDLLILEGAWVGASTSRAFSVCGYEALSKRYGVPLFDTKQDSFTQRSSGGMAMQLSDKTLALDYLINLPVLKGHCQTKVTGALKNLKGCISDAEKRRFHTLGLHQPIAHLNTLIKTDFILVDSLCGDLDFEEGGNPVRMNRVLCGKDPVLVDAYIASAMGYDPYEIGYIKLAEQLSVGSADIEGATVSTIRKDSTKARGSSSRKVGQLAKAVDARDACSACYANLIHALARLEGEGKLRAFYKNKICIGQGFKGVEKDGVGVGNCAAGLSQNISGCPPDARRILAFLKDQA
ncbi:MAG TPA: iron-sulfur cluster-binding protein [Clostridiales bacterium]|nr:iron-sulfur cluster-binding protein [Clostridiales bacterium]